MSPGMDYTREVGKSRFDNSAAKTLIYQMQEVAPDRGHHGRQYRTLTPFATCEDDEKYPMTFVARKKGREGSDKVGGRNKDFDPEVYRQQIRDYTTGKVESQKKAYFGAGNILSHHGVSHMPPMRGFQKDLPSTVAECMMSPTPPSFAGSGTHHAPSEAGAPHPGYAPHPEYAYGHDDAASYAASMAAQGQ